MYRKKKKESAFIYLDLPSLKQVLLPNDVSSPKLISFRFNEIWSSFMPKIKSTEYGVV